MENVVSVILPLCLVLMLIRVVALPIKLVWKVLIHSGCGFLCMWILNWSAGLTGISVPVNPVTAAIAGFLGLPGIGLIALGQLFL